MGFKSARIAAGKTVHEVMNEIGVSDSAVYQWETGACTPRASLLPRIATIYGCSIEELLDGNNSNAKSRISRIHRRQIHEKRTVL